MLKMLLKKLTILLESVTTSGTPPDVVAEQAKPLQDVKIYTEEGKLIESYDGVYLSHWDKNIYHLYTKEGGDLIIRIDKAANMMLTAQDVFS